MGGIFCRFYGLCNHVSQSRSQAPQSFQCTQEKNHMSDIITRTKKYKLQNSSNCHVFLGGCTCGFKLWRSKNRTTQRLVTATICYSSTLLYWRHHLCDLDTKLLPLFSCTLTSPGTRPHVAIDVYTYIVPKSLLQEGVHQCMINTMVSLAYLSLCSVCKQDCEI